MAIGMMVISQVLWLKYFLSGKHNNWLAAYSNELNSRFANGTLT